MLVSFFFFFKVPSGTLQVGVSQKRRRTRQPSQQKDVVGMNNNNNNNKICFCFQKGGG